VRVRTRTGVENPLSGAAFLDAEGHHVTRAADMGCMSESAAAVAVRIGLAETVGPVKGGARCVFSGRDTRGESGANAQIREAKVSLERWQGEQSEWVNLYRWHRPTGAVNWRTWGYRGGQGRIGPQEISHA